MRIAMFQGYDPRVGYNDPAVLGVTRLARNRQLRAYGYGDLINIVTPGQILDAATQLDSEYDKLDADITSSASSDAFKKGWAGQLATWKGYFDSLQGLSGWGSRLWAGSMTEVDNYRNRLVAWQTSFEQAGGTITGAASAVAPKAPSILDALGDLKWVAIGIAAIIVVPKVINLFSSGKKGGA